MFSSCFFSLDILWYFFFPYSLFLFIFSSDKFLYLSLLAVLIFFYYFHINLLLYLVSHLCFFDSNFLQWNCIQRSSTLSFFIQNKKITKHPFYRAIRSVHYANCIIFTHISKVNFVSTSFNINNSDIFKTHSLLH